MKSPDALIRILTADKAYDDSGNHILLESKGIESAIIQDDYQRERPEQAGLNSDERERCPQDWRIGTLQDRVRVWGSKAHRLARCRYLGIDGCKVQAFMTAIAMNLKRKVRFLTGANFRGRANAWA